MPSLFDLTDQFYKDVPSWADFFAKNILAKAPSTQMQYLEGWQPRMDDPNYNTPLATLLNYQGGDPATFTKLPSQGINWDDVGPAGARWHGSDKTPGGEWLKAPFSPEKEYGYAGELMQDDILKRLLNRF
jgi:hypothetical protein